MQNRTRLAATALTIWLAAAFAGADPARVDTLLQKRILDCNLVRTEVENYLDNHVAAMPKVESVAQWEKIIKDLRRDLLDQVIFRGEAARWREAPYRVDWLETIPGGPGYHIRKLRFEALPGFWIPALLYLPDKLSGKVPVVLNVAYEPKQMRCINLAKRGLIALNLGWIGMGQLGTAGYDHYRLNQIDLCGTSGVAPFFLSMTRALDILLALPNADPSRVAMAGLSGGGWQTIFCSSLDPRVELANPVAGFSDFKTRAHFQEDLGDSEQAPVDMAVIADYTHLVAMRAPKPILLTYNSKDDCCFASGHALAPLLAAGQPIYQLYGRPESLRSHVNEDPGTHNFLKDNRQAFYRMVGDFFYPGDKNFSADEIESASEAKKPQDLLVTLPEPNLDLHSLAVGLAKALPRDPAIPSNRTAIAGWQKERRALLSRLLRIKDYRLADEPAGRERGGDAAEAAVFWRLRLENGPGEQWTAPAAEITIGDPKSTVILLSDKGRASAAPEVSRLLAGGARVLAVDLFNFGETATHTRYPIHIACSGGRPLGIEAAHLAAISRWLAKGRGFGPVRIISLGPRSGLIALVAAGLEEASIAGVEFDKGLKSLKEALDRNLTVEDAPELFTFGLLEKFDIPQLAALVSPRPVVWK